MKHAWNTANWSAEAQVHVNIPKKQKAITAQIRAFLVQQMLKFHFTTTFVVK